MNEIRNHLRMCVCWEVLQSWKNRKDHHLQYTPFYGWGNRGSEILWLWPPVWLWVKCLPSAPVVTLRSWIEPWVGSLLLLFPLPATPSACARLCTLFLTNKYNFKKRRNILSDSEMEQWIHLSPKFPLSELDNTLGHLTQSVWYKERELSGKGNFFGGPGNLRRNAPMYSYIMDTAGPWSILQMTIEKLSDLREITVR